MPPRKRPPSDDDEDRPVPPAPKKRARRVYPPSSIKTRSARFVPITAVLLTTELLENILIHLPMKDLLLAQRVCKKWRAVIQQNKNLQRALFFLPEEPTIFWESTPCGGFICGCVKRVERAQYDRVDNISSRGYSVRFNPLLQLSESLSNDRNLISWGSRNSLGARINMRIPHDIPEASWRRMLVTQPPMQHRYCAEGYVGGVSYCTNLKFVPHVAAPTAGTLFNDVTDAVKSQRESSWAMGQIWVDIAGAIVSTEEEEEDGVVSLIE